MPTMVPFVPPEPPLVPDTPEESPSLLTPEPPPVVGLGSPWAPADAENRDRILDWWRAWFLRVFFPWIRAWIAYWAAQWARIIAYLNEWLAYAGEYIEDHAVNGHSWWKTDTPINTTGTTVVTITPAEEFRPLLVGDLVSDTTRDVSYGRVVAVIDDTHAEVTYIGSLIGRPGYGWWPTLTSIAHGGTTIVALTPNPAREFQVGDFVVDNSETSSYGHIIALVDATHAEVLYIGDLQGPPGIAESGSYQYTTPELTPGDVAQVRMDPQPNMVGAFRLTTTARSWVRVYASQAYMIADEDRPITTPLNIADDHGCYLDFVGIPDELDKTLTPGIMFTDIGDGLWLSITNTNVIDSVEITIEFTYRVFKE